MRSLRPAYPGYVRNRGFGLSYCRRQHWFLYRCAGSALHGYIDVDDGALYVLSQYCDQLVDDGYGGQEPRMTLNAYITEQVSARDILDKMGIPYSRS